MHQPLCYFSPLPSFFFWIASFRPTTLQTTLLLSKTRPSSHFYNLLPSGHLPSYSYFWIQVMSASYIRNHELSMNTVARAFEPPPPPPLYFYDLCSTVNINIAIPLNRIRTRITCLERGRN